MRAPSSAPGVSWVHGEQTARSALKPVRPGGFAYAGLKVMLLRARPKHPAGIDETSSRTEKEQHHVGTVCASGY